jgi:ATP-dependent helicase HrpB
VTVPDSAGDLPVVEALPELAAALQAHNAAVLVAPPGAGKTSAVPLFLREQPFLRSDSAAPLRIVMLEPRRLATRAAAQRMASLLGERVGDTVGYQTRDERHIGPDTVIEVVTEGVLTRRLQHDPSLDGVGLVIFDEIHERNVPTDLGLAFALDVQRTIRPDLRILAMSATPDISRLTSVLDSAPTISSEGRMHPVDVRWLPMSKADRLDGATAAAVLRAIREEHGDILVFLPGIADINRVQALIQPELADNVDVFPLAGALSLAEHDAALTPSQPGRRRVVLSTDIAESSLTVSGVRVVVDAGLAKVPRYDVRTGMTKLTTVSTSRASADQRMGRAGRTEPGVCYRLWSKLEHATRRAHLEAEITQVDLAGVALEVAAWGTPVTELSWIDTPPSRTMAAGIELLQNLGALDEGRVTERGQRMMRLPLHPRLARMVDGADAYDASTACVIAALLDERDVFRGRSDELPADLALRVGVVSGRDSHDRADHRSVRRIRERAADIARRARIDFQIDRCNPDRCGALLALAYPDRIAVRRSQAGQFQLRSGAGAFTRPDDPLAHERFIVAADLDGNRNAARVRIGAALSTDELVAALADEIEVRRVLTWDKQRDDLLVRIETRLGGMLLDEQVRAAEPGDETTEALLARVHATRLGALRWTDAANSLRARAAFLHTSAPNGEGDEPWPDFSDRTLLATLDTWLAPYLIGARNAADLAAVDVHMVLLAGMSWDRAASIDQLAPLAMITASGRAAPIDYTRDQPTVSVRVQDMFGTNEHPTVAGGLVPIVLELLSPADRPLQTTADLPGFWAGSWADVRKEMAGRYPKHEWPTDPASADARRLKRRRTD